MKSYVLECMLLKYFKESNNNTPIYCMFKNEYIYIYMKIFFSLYVTLKIYKEI